MLIGADASDSIDGVRSALCATDVKVYELFPLRPVIVQDPLGPDTWQAAPPGLAVTVIEVGVGPISADVAVTEI